MREYTNSDVGYTTTRFSNADSNKLKSQLDKFMSKHNVNIEDIQREAMSAQLGVKITQYEAAQILATLNQSYRTPGYERLGKLILSSKMKGSGGRWSHESEFWRDAYKKARHFIFHRSSAGFSKLSKLDAHAELSLDLPFPVCTFSAPGGALNSFHYTEERGIFLLTCLLVVEIEPKKYRFMGFEDRVKAFDQGSSGAGIQVTAETMRYHEDNDAEAASTLSVILDELHSSDGCSGWSKTHAVIKEIDDNNKKSFHRIKEIIHIGKKTIMHENSSRLMTPINFSHRFEVRGHWRETPGLGKDRDGNYNTPGFTWVRPHEKGPENLPLVKKVRIFDESVGLGNDE